MVLGFRKKATAEPIETVASPLPSSGVDESTAVDNDNKVVDTGAAHTTALENLDDDIVDESVAQLQKFQKAHRWDLNLPIEKLDAVDNAVGSEDIEKKVGVEHALLEENSPYPEVVAAVRNYDEYVLSPRETSIWDSIN